MSQQLPEKYDLRVGFSERDLQGLLVAAMDLKCSDVKIQSNDYVTVYYKRQWFAFSTRRLEDAEAKKALGYLAGQAAVTMLGSGKEVDPAPEFFRSEESRRRVRFRLNGISCRVGGIADGISITMRSIPEGLPDLTEMALPAELAPELLPRRGIVLMTGPTGSGKTTTIAACLNERAKERPGPCIITYEQPPEFSYDFVGLGHAPLVSQAEIGMHLSDWSRAGPTAMRRKADIILMGEVRQAGEAEATIEMGITGHCVYGTLHADTPHESIFRLVEMFPHEARAAAASKLLGSLRTICSQKLVKTLSGGIVPLRSWVSFDSEMKDDLSSEEWPYPRWAAYVRQHVRTKGHDFATQSIPLIEQGEINSDMFREITQMGREEALTYFNRYAKKVA